MAVAPPGRPATIRRAVHGILLLDKPLGISSNQALQIARRAFGAAKAGHTGNLDVAASGLLPLCFGEATKVCGFLLDSDKRYQATVRLGHTSSTGDIEGELIATGVPPPTTSAALEQALGQLRGPIQQVPPMYSALKHAGQPLYKLARQGIEIARKARAITIYQLDLVSFADDLVALDIRCSKGTYIRSLAVSLGEILGCGAYLAGLRRLEAGPFDVIAASALTVFQSSAYAARDFDELLLPMDVALAGLPRVTLASEAAVRFQRGQTVECEDPPEKNVAGMSRVYHARGQFLGVGSVTAAGRVAPKRLVNLEPSPQE
jgi:tRNA pseudouridine55 synthase